MTLLLKHFDTLLATPAHVDHLNRAILTLAVQGRLVPQDPGDEPAGIKKAKEHPDLPKGWSKKILGEVCTIARGGSPRPIQNFITDDPNGINWIKIGDTKNSTKYVTATEEKIRPEGAKFSRMVHEGDFILSNSMSFGRPYIMKTSGCIHDGWLVLQDIDSNIDQDYLYYMLSSDFVFSQFDKLAAGSTVRNLNSGLVRGVEITIPPLAEQKRIVARVESLLTQTRALAEKLSRAESDLTALNQSALAHLLAADSPEEFDRQWDFLAAHFESLFIYPEHVAPLRQSILELAVRGKLTRREAGDESARELLKQIYQEKQETFPAIKESEKSFEIPRTWEYIRLGELAKFIDYRGHTPNKIESGMRLITAKNVRMGRLNIEPKEYVDPAIYDKWMTRGIPHKGDLLFTTEAPMGNVCMLDTDEKVLFAQRLITLKLYGNVDSKFAMFALMSKPLQQQILEKSSGVTARGIKAKLLKTVLMPLPPLAEQARIVAKVERLLGLCDALESRLRAAQEERSRLVESVLAGVGVG